MCSIFDEHSPSKIHASAERERVSKKNFSQGWLDMTGEEAEGKKMSSLMSYIKHIK